MPEIILVKAVQTCWAAPVQWDAWDQSGRYWYIRFRSGRGTAGRTYSIDDAPIYFLVETEGDEITLEEFCVFAGITWAPEAKIPGTVYEDPPDIEGVRVVIV